VRRRNRSLLTPLPGGPDGCLFFTFNHPRSGLEKWKRLFRHRGQRVSSGKSIPTRKVPFPNLRLLQQRELGIFEGNSGHFEIFTSPTALRASSGSFWLSRSSWRKECRKRAAIALGSGATPSFSNLVNPGDELRQFQGDCGRPLLKPVLPLFPIRFQFSPTMTATDSQGGSPNRSDRGPKCKQANPVCHFPGDPRDFPQFSE